VSEVVVAEAVSGHRRLTDEAKVGLVRWAAKHGALGLSAVATTAQETINRAADAYDSTLRRALVDAGAEIIDPPNIPHMQLVKRATERRRPCNSNGDGYRDTLNWLSLLAIAKDHPDEEIVWVSNNSRDFANDEESSLHDDLLADLTEAGLDGRVQWFRTLPDLLLELATAHALGAADLLQVHQRLREEALLGFLEDKILSTPADLPIDPKRCGLPVLTLEATALDVSSPINLDIKVSGSVTGDVVAAEFTFDADVALALLMPAAKVPDEQSFAIVSVGANGAVVHTEKRLRFTGLLTLGPLERPTDAELTRISAMEGDPGLASWADVLQRKAFNLDLLKKFPQPTIDPAIFEAITKFPQPTIDPAIFEAITKLPQPTIDPAIFETITKFPQPTIDPAIFEAITKLSQPTIDPAIFEAITKFPKPIINPIIEFLKKNVQSAADATDTSDEDDASTGIVSADDSISEDQPQGEDKDPPEDADKGPGQTPPK